MDLTKPRVVIVGGGFAGVAAARASSPGTTECPK
jgi:cation diffusion facilitator CzcD-associated flavoprotein CzcO